MSENFNEEYFENGIKLGISGYENYRWIPELTIPAAMTLIDRLGIKPEENILDFGCAKGYWVKAFRLLHRKAWGYDISKYAISNCDKDIKEYLSLYEPGNRTYFFTKFDIILAKDVLEHMTEDEIETFLLNCKTSNPRIVFLTIPLAENGKFIISSCEQDVTHIQRKTLEEWTSFFIEREWTVECCTEIKGLKSPSNKGVGFFTLS